MPPPAPPSLFCRTQAQRTQCPSAPPPPTTTPGLSCFSLRCHAPSRHRTRPLQPPPFRVTLSTFLSTIPSSSAPPVGTRIPFPTPVRPSVALVSRSSRRPASPMAMLQHVSQEPRKTHTCNLSRHQPAANPMPQLPQHPPAVNHNAMLPTLAHLLPHSRPHTTTSISTPGLNTSLPAVTNIAKRLNNLSGALQLTQPFWADIPHDGTHAPSNTDDQRCLGGGFKNRPGVRLPLTLAARAPPPA